MRLFVLALAVPAIAQPAMAREHSRHNHHWSQGVNSHHQLVSLSRRHRLPTADEAWRYRVDARVAVRERLAVSAGPQSERQGFAHADPFAARATGHGDLDAMIARHAQMNGVPEALVHRVVVRESRYRPGVVGRGGAMGLMQIKYATARAMGYTGSPAGLLDPETNLTYAVRYLAGAYRVAGGNANRAVANYARGYYGAAKRQGVSPYQSAAWSRPEPQRQPVEQLAYAQVVDRPLRVWGAGGRNRRHPVHWD
jgi:soluble lytic murein transglycosylase-like protein